MQYLVTENNIFFDNPELNTIKEFAKCTDRQLKFVIFYADRKSPFKQLPDKEREKICLTVGYGKEGNRPDRNSREIIAGKVETIETAIARYKELQYDENADTLAVLNAQIHEIKEFIKSDKTIETKDEKGKVIKKVTDGKAVETALKLSKQLPELIKAKLDVESLLNITTDHKPTLQTYSSLDLPTETEEGGTDNTEMSTIDRFHLQNQKKQE